uniref:Transposase n=1 Tax=Oncorhynchus tshawytscha TaxID=74940 RepID=A0AAZ3S1T4_ONCTS
MVTLKETRAVIIALHKKGFPGKDIAASKIAPKSTIYRIIKNFKESGLIVVKKASGRPRKSSKRQDHLLKLIQLRDRGTTSTELAQEWQQAGVSASSHTVRQRLLEDGLVSRRAAKKPFLSRKNIRDRLIFYRYSTGTGIGLLRTGVKSFSLMNPLSDCLGHPDKSLSGEDKVSATIIPVMPTVKHPETIHMRGCFSAKGVGSLTILPKNTAMYKEWYQHILREQLLPTIQEQFGDEQCLFQHDGAPCHKAKVAREQNIDILGPWPGNSPDLNPIENLWSILKRRVDKQKPTNSDQLQALIMQEWAAISQDVTQKLIDSMTGQIAEVLKKKGQHCKY